MNKEDFIKVINGLDIKTIEGFCLRITNSDNEKGFIQQGLEYIELQQRIDKAIEYIKTFIEIDEETGTYSMPYTFDGANLYHLLKILKGVDNE